MGLLDYEQLMGNPLLQAGLGILANNNSRNAGQVIGNGLMQGFGNVQSFRNQQQDRQMRQQQIDDMKMYRDAQIQNMQQQQDERMAKVSAMSAFKTKYPQFAELAALDPSAAIKAAIPSAGGVEYGLVPQVGMNNGKPEKFVQAKDGSTKWLGIAPTLDELKAQEMIDKGIIDPNNPLYSRFMSQIGAGGQPQQNNAPQSVPVASAMPYTWSGPTATDIKEGTSPNMQLRDPANPLPPASRRQLQVKQGEASIDVSKQRQIDQNQADINVATENAKEAAKKTRTMSGLGAVISQARDILSKETPTASGVGSIADKAAGYVGIATKGSVGAAKLKALGGNLIMKMPRMEGPQSNLDQELYREQAGRVGDETLPIEQRLAALDVVESIYSKYDKNVIPSGAQMPQQGKRNRADVLKQYGVR